MRNTSILTPIGFFLTVSLLVGSVSNAQAVKFSVANADGSVDSTVNTPLLVEKGVGIGALQLNVIYDPAVLQPTAVEPAAGVNALVDFNVISPGTLRLALASTQGIENDGEVVQIEWKVLGGSSTRLDLAEARAWEQKTSFELPVATAGGEFKVAEAVAEPAAPAASEPAAPATGLPLPWLIGIAVIGVIILLLLMILVLRRKPEPKGA